MWYTCSAGWPNLARWAAAAACCAQHNTTSSWSCCDLSVPYCTPPGFQLGQQQQQHQLCAASWSKLKGRPGRPGRPGRQTAGAHPPKAALAPLGRKPKGWAAPPYLGPCQLSQGGDVRHHQGGVGEGLCVDDTRPAGGNGGADAITRVSAEKGPQVSWC